MAKTKILYIDDEEINLRLFKINLGKKYDVIPSSSGQEGIKILEECDDIPIVVTDVRMPHMSGIEFIKTARELHPTLVFFILSGHDITEEIENLVELGVIKKYFRKPFNLKEMGCRNRVCINPIKKGTGSLF